ncbi:MAG: hypothetical protein ACPGJS_09975 [Flammeovirgaceae bacterium]
MDGGDIAGIIAVSIPIVAIIGGFISTTLKARYKARAAALGSGEVQQLQERLDKLEAENQDLKRQVNNLQTIVLDDPTAYVQLPPAEENLDEKMEELLRQKEKLKTK